MSRVDIGRGGVVDEGNVRVLLIDYLGRVQCGGGCTMESGTRKFPQAVVFVRTIRGSSTQLAEVERYKCSEIQSCTLPHELILGLSFSGR